MKKQISIGLILLFTTVVAAAQNTSFHHIFFDLGGGLHSLLYSPENGNEKIGGGETFNVGYRYFFNQSWGIGTSLGISHYSASTNFRSNFFKPEFDAENNMNYELRTTCNNWEEKQNLLQIEIPFGAIFRQPIKNNWEFLGGAGLKLAILAWNTYKTTGSYEVSGFYPELGQEFRDLPNHGFYKQETSIKSQSDFHPIDVLMYLDLGFTYEFYKDINVYFGLYVSYGLTNLTYNTTGDLFAKSGYAGVLNSAQIDNVHTATFGAKVGMVFNR